MLIGIVGAFVARYYDYRSKMVLICLFCAMLIGIVPFFIREISKE